jgi:hypothetical protein
MNCLDYCIATSVQLHQYHDGYNDGYIYDGAVADGGAEERGNPYIINRRVIIG